MRRKPTGRARRPPFSDLDCRRLHPSGGRASFALVRFDIDRVYKWVSDLATSDRRDYPRPRLLALELVFDKDEICGAALTPIAAANDCAMAE
jgi:hypothetical protein